MTSVKFNNGLDFPLLGLGTYKSDPGVVSKTIQDAIAIGYRHIDCAYIYENEKEVGEGIRKKIEDGTVKREELFVTTKLWNTWHEKGKVVPAIKKSLCHLDLDYVDLYLIHWPVSFEDIGINFPKNNDGELLLSEMDYKETWKGMEECVRFGLTKSIGLSNFNIQQIKDILEIATIKPVNNQVECHPYLNQSKLIHYCKSEDITVTAYSPLGRPMVQRSHQLLDDPVLKEIAGNYGKMPGQIVIKYQLQRGVSVIPKSTNHDRLKKNFEVFDFNISDNDMNKINSLDRGERFVTFSEAVRSKFYPFHAE